MHSYVEVYEELLAPYRRQDVVALEIGIMGGASLRMFEEYFSEGIVYGIDLNDHPMDMADLRPMITEGTHRIVLMDATNSEAVNRNFQRVKFDVVIEDASHILEHQLTIYENFKSKLNPGAVYIIEDVDRVDEVRPIFERIDPSKTVRVMDRRHIKGRFDDVLVVITSKM